MHALKMEHSKGMSKHDHITLAIHLLYTSTPEAGSEHAHTVLLLPKVPFGTQWEKTCVILSPSQVSMYNYMATLANSL